MNICIVNLYVSVSTYQDSAFSTVMYSLLEQDIERAHLVFYTSRFSPFTNWVVSSYKESRNNMPIYGYMLPNLSPSPNLYKVQSACLMILKDKLSPPTKLKEV